MVSFFADTHPMFGSLDPVAFTKDIDCHPEALDIKATSKHLSSMSERSRTLCPLILTGPIPPNFILPMAKRENPCYSRAGARRARRSSPKFQATGKSVSTFMGRCGA